MNPLDFRGPDFLVFYFLFGIFVVISVWLLRRWSESGMPIPSGVADPYLIAYLRGGEKEAVSVAVLAMIDGGQLRLQDEGLVASDPEAAARARRPLEKAILAGVATSGDERALAKHPRVEAALREYRESLRQMGAIPKADTNRSRAFRFLIALALLWALAAAKVVVALNRGRHNIGFLLALALIFGIVIAVLAFPRRTGRGDALLSDLQLLFRPLKHRVGTLTHGLDKNEFALLAATFGMPLLAATEAGTTFGLFRRKSSSGSSCGFFSSCGGSSGSSCGGSGGGSCGSGCGGGGCGGGCGGCGG